MASEIGYDAAESRRKRIATAISADIMRGRFGQASRLILVVNGQHESSLTHDSIVEKVMIVLREQEVQ
jgi:hypothetical protein